MLGFLHDEVAALADAEAGVDAVEADLGRLTAALGAILGRGDVTAAAWEGLDGAAAIAERAAELVDETYEAREREFGDEIARAVERWVLLRTIDTHWTEHLTAMEELREGIHLRGYGQQDPLVAYKNEAHTYFDEMKARIASGVAQTILRVSIKTAEQAEREEQQPHRTVTTAGGDGVRPAGPPPGTKLGRNDPCYCGSGKKYKKCHGR